MILGARRGKELPPHCVIVNKFRVQITRAIFILDREGKIPCGRGYSGWVRFRRIDCSKCEL